MQWIYKKKIVRQAPAGYIGFVYLVTNLVDNRIYVGKKIFRFKRKYKPQGRRKAKKVYSVESDWKTYLGSSQELQKDISRLGKACFTKEILRFCKTKSEMGYYEGFYMYKLKVMFKPSYNKWIVLRVRKDQI